MLSELSSVHPETPDDASWCFQFINEQFSARSRDCAEACLRYAAQEIPQIDPPEAEKRAIYGWKLSKLSDSRDTKYVVAQNALCFTAPLGLAKST